MWVLVQDDEDWEEATVHGSEPPEAVTPERLKKGTEEADSSPVTQEQVQDTGEAAFGSVIPDIDAPLTSTSLCPSGCPLASLQQHSLQVANMQVQAVLAFQNLLLSCLSDRSIVVHSFPRHSASIKARNTPK